MARSEANASEAPDGAAERGWLTRPAHELSAAIKEGRLTCAQLCQLTIERIRRVQPHVNGMAQDRFEAAAREAAELDELLARSKLGQAAESGDQPQQPQQQQLTEAEREMLRSGLFGVPLSVKESIGIKGMRQSAGAWARRDTLAEEDAVVVRCARRFGMVPVCTSNVPELTLFWADCHNPVYGRSRNPYDKARITGASSGGEGALLGAGATHCGVGSDIGGSLRNPAHYCGVASHKPSPFLVSAEGNYPALKESRLRLFTLGPMCRYASDLRHLLAVLMSDTPGENPRQDSYGTFQPADIGERRRRLLAELAELPLARDAQALTRLLGRVKFLHGGELKQTGRLMALLGQRETRVQRDIAQAQQAVLAHFASKFSCQVQQIDLDKHLERVFEAWQVMIMCAGTVDREQAFEANEIAHLFGIKRIVPELLRYCLGASKHTKESLATILFGLPMPSDRQRAYKLGEQLERLVADMKSELELAMGEFGCVLMPTLPTTAHRHHAALLRTREVRFPCLWNICQMPATHVPLGLDKKRGLPFGLTVASRPYNDALTIAVAEEIERAFGGWRPPPAPRAP